MRFVWAVFKREVRSYFVSPLAYTATAVFLLIEGLLFAASIGEYQRRLVQSRMNPRLELPGMDQFVRDLLGDNVVWALFLIVPLLTMRLLAEERRQHTAELLLTAPMKTRHIVAGKFFGSTVVMALMLALTGWMPLALKMWGDCDPAVIVCGYLGAILYGSFLLAIGILASSLTESIMIAALVSLLLVAAVNVAGPLASQIPYIGQSLEQFTPVVNLQRLARGVIDSQAVIYFTTLTWFLLDLTARVLDSQRWR